MSKQITKAEFQVMDVLWAESPLAASTVADRLATETGWSLKTVKTLLSRLVEKGALRHEPDGRRFLYHPKVTRDAYARRAAKGASPTSFSAGGPRRWWRISRRATAFPTTTCASLKLCWRS